MKKIKIKKNCLICNISFETYPDHSPSQTKKYCSRFCESKSRTGKKRSEDFSKKMSILKTGSNNPMWKGGTSSIKSIIRNSYKYRQWRSDVFTRDNFTCIFCLQRGGILNADHIKPFALILYENNIKYIDQANSCEELWNINNGRTLCLSCHKKTETYAKNIKPTNGD